MRPVIEFIVFAVIAAPVVYIMYKAYRKEHPKG